MSVYRILRPLKTNILARCSRSKPFPLCSFVLSGFFFRNHFQCERMTTFMRSSIRTSQFKNAICRQFLHPSDLRHSCVVNRIVCECGIVHRYWTNLYGYGIPFTCVETSVREKLVSYRCVVLRGAATRSRVTCRYFNGGRPVVLLRLTN